MNVREKLATGYYESKKKQPDTWDYLADSIAAQKLELEYAKDIDIYIEKFKNDVFKEIGLSGYILKDELFEFACNVCYPKKKELLLEMLEQLARFVTSK